MGMGYVGLVGLCGEASVKEGHFRKNVEECSYKDESQEGKLGGQVGVWSEGILCGGKMDTNYGK